MNNREDISFEALFQYSTIGILVSDEAGEIVLVNKFLLNQFEYQTAEELTGKNVEVLIPKRYHHNHTQYRVGYNKNPTNRPMGIGRDLFAIKKNGSEFPVELSLGNYSTEKGIFTIVYIIDISKRKEIENAVLDQKKQLAEVNKQLEALNNEMEHKVHLRTRQLQQSKEELTKTLSKERELSDLKSRFVSMASHEFRTPLSTILSSASLLAKYTSTEQQVNRDKHIQRIKNSVNNLTDLLNEFLSIGKIEDGKVGSHFVTFDLFELLSTIINEMQNLAKTGQHIKYTHIGYNTINLDPQLLRNIILNLLSNAIKFSNENSVINVTSKVEKAEISITIKDSGIGISDVDKQHLFERFFRGTNATNIQGTGLGLHIVSKYIDIMKGEISYNSELNKGTEFTITFKVD